MVKQSKMQCGRKNGGEERKRGQIMGMWLSLSAPRIQLCHICKECFPSLKALWGHQNAHRGGENKQQQQIRKRKVLEEEEAPNGGDTSSPSKRARNSADPDAGNNNNEIIDLELRLGSSHYPAPKFYDFMGLQLQQQGHAAVTVAATPSSPSAVIDNNNNNAVAVCAAAESEPIAVVVVDVTLKL